MENLFSMWKVRELADKVTNVVMNYTEIEAKVREATNDEAWGPTGNLMQELAHATFTYEHFPEVMSMLWKRMLQDSKTHWRRSYKSLLLLNYLIKNGSERVVTSAREHIYDLRSLENFTFIDEQGKDQGVNIRHKVKELIEFIQDDDRLREERKKAKKNKDKYIGMSSDMISSRFGGSNGWDDFSTRNDFQGDVDSNNQYRDKSQDEDYELDREDSDNESNQNNHSKNLDERINSPNVDKKKVSLNISNMAKSPVKLQKQVKKVDLGAAANFGKVTMLQNNTNNKDLLNEDFNPRAGEENFGDFANAFGSNTEKESSPVLDDDFADFTSAFSNNTKTIIPSIPQDDLFILNNTNVAQSTSKSLSADLLDDFSSLALGNAFSSAPSNNGNNIDSTNGVTDNLLDEFISPLVMPEAQNILQPSSSNATQMPQTSLEHQRVPSTLPSTWSNSGSLNINLDNLMDNNSKQPPAPKLNQIPSNPTSPINQQRVMMTTLSDSQRQLNFSNANNQLFGVFK